MRTLKIGIENHGGGQSGRPRAALGEQRAAHGEAAVWFASTESFARVLSAKNRELLGVIAERAPGSLEELAVITGRAKSNLSRTLKTMERHGIVRLERGARRRVRARVAADRLVLELPLTKRAALEEVDVRPTRPHDPRLLERLIEPEWLEWYRMTPASRWRESAKLWPTFLALGGILDPDADSHGSVHAARPWRQVPPERRPGVHIVRRSGV